MGDGMSVRKIESIQVKMIHTAVSKLGLSDEEYRETLEGRYGKASCKGLTYAEASCLIDWFKTLGFRIERRRRHTAATPSRDVFLALPPKDRPANVVLLPSRDQLDMIDTLAKKVAWKVEDGFSRWRKKYMKIDRIKTAGQASDVIEGLKGLLDHQRV